MDVKAPPAKQAGDMPAQPAPAKKDEDSKHTPPKQPAAKQKKQGAGLPVTAITLTILAMVVLCGLAVVVYMKSR